MDRGKFIVVEGADGAGTTTIASMIATEIEAISNGNVYHTQEPSDGEIGRLIRRMLEKELQPVGRREMFHLFMADRIYHVRNRIKPRLDAGFHVVCDRYLASTLVYQSVEGSVERSKGIMRGLYDEIAINDVDHLEEPDVVLFLDAEAEIMKKRRTSRGGKAELFEEDDFQQKVVQLYRTWFDDCYRKNGGARIDTGRSVDMVKAECWDIVKRIM